MRQHQGPAGGGRRLSPWKAFRRLPERSERASSLDRAAGVVGRAIGRAIPPGRVTDALSGTWLGHPVHPPLTDLPIGFWTSAWALDLVGGPQSRDAASRLVALGVLSAAPTALSGASDWRDTTGAARRVGLVHAAANSAALVCYAASWAQRRRSRHASGVAWGWAGATAATVGGLFGGHLVSALGVGVDATVFDEGPSVWTPATVLEELPAPFQLVDVLGVAVSVVDHEDTVVAFADRCTHRGGPLHEGTLVGDCIECPWHASVFRLADGEVVRGPASRPQPRYDVWRADGRLQVRRLGR